MSVVPADAAECTVRSALIGLGVSDDHAALQAAHLIEGDLRGHPSHGVQRLPVLAERIRAGLISLGVDPVTSEPTAAVSVVDGHDCLGPVAAAAAIAALQRSVAEEGIGIAIVRDSAHVGMLAPYVELLSEGGLIGIATTISEALVHPIGGKRALIGTNPFAVAVPTDDEHPFVLDMATGVVSMGQIIAYDIAGKELEPGWAIDSDGHPTTDAHRAREGAIAPFGGMKGYGLGLALELLVVLLTGCAIGAEVHGTLDVTSKCNKGDVFIAIDPKIGGADSGAAVANYLDLIRASSDGDMPVTIHGDRSRLLREDRLRDGIPVDPNTWNQVCALAASANEGELL